MSEEEIISSINALILYASCQKDSGEKYKKVAVDNIDIQALNGILDLYNKEKEKNKELTEILKCTQNSWYEDTQVIEELKKDKKELVVANKFKEEIKEKFVSKDQIRERIKELEEIRDENADEIKRNVRFYSIYDSYDLQIDELKELLEE